MGSLTQFCLRYDVDRSLKSFFNSSFLSIFFFSFFLFLFFFPFYFFGRQSSYLHNILIGLVSDVTSCQQSLERDRGGGRGGNKTKKP